MGHLANLEKGLRAEGYLTEEQNQPTENFQPSDF